MEQEMFYQPAMVYESFVPGSSREVSEYQAAKHQLHHGYQVNAEQEQLIDLIRDAVSELAADDIASAVAFHEVTDQNLPPCHFVSGDVLIWNDAFVPKKHPARRHCGEGPFKVVRDENYLVAFVTDRNNRVTSDVRTGKDRLVLLNLSTFGLIIAHGSFFMAVEKG